MRRERPPPRRDYLEPPLLPGFIIVSAETRASAHTYEMTTPFSPAVAVPDKIDLSADA
jgi:hypothetical protein